MESLETVFEDPLYPVKVELQAPMAIEIKLSDVWLNELKYHHFKIKRGYKSGLQKLSE